MPRAFDDVREETGATRLDEAVNVLGKRADRERRSPVSCRGKQPLGILAREQTDRRQAGGKDAAPWRGVALAGGVCGRCEASPGHRPAQAEPVQQCRIVFGDSRWQQIPLPGRGRGLESGQLSDDLQETGFAVEPRPCCDMLPLKQELHEVGRRDRLDFPPESPDRETVNPCEQPTITPFYPRTIPPEPPAQRLTVRLKAEERSLHFRSRQMELPGQLLGCRGAGALHPALNDSTDCFIPFLEFLCANFFDRRTVFGGREDRANRGEAFGGDPAGDGRGSGGGGGGAVGGAPFPYDGRPASLEQGGEEDRPCSSFLLPHPDQRLQSVVQIVRARLHPP